MWLLAGFNMSWVVWGPWYFDGCCLEEALQSLPHEPLHGVARGMVAHFIRVSNQEEQRKREAQKKAEATVFITYLEHGNLCHILFVKSSSLGPAHAKDKTLHKSMHTAGKIVGSLFRNCLPPFLWCFTLYAGSSITTLFSYSPYCHK